MAILCCAGCVDVDVWNNASQMISVARMTRPLQAKAFWRRGMHICPPGVAIWQKANNCWCQATLQGDWVLATLHIWVSWAYYATWYTLSLPWRLIAVLVGTWSLPSFIDILVLLLLVGFVVWTHGAGAEETGEDETGEQSQAAYSFVVSQGSLALLALSAVDWTVFRAVVHFWNCYVVV